VIELYGNLDIWTTDETSPFGSEDVYQLRDLLKSPNHQGVRDLSPNATRSGFVPISHIMSSTAYSLSSCAAEDSARA
jgi:hypothetical protein